MQTGQSGQLYIKLVAGGSFNIATVLNDQSNRMIERMNIECDTAGLGGAINIQLPSFAVLAGLLNFEVIITDTGNNAGVNNINIIPAGSNTINQASSYAITTNKGAAYLLGGTQNDWAGFNTGAGVGSGTVTSFSSGNLSPLFTTSVATGSSTPALSFSLSTQNANKIFAGPATGADAAPTFRALVAADIAGLAGSGTVTDFTAGTLSPLFSTSVATSTTTPALSFTLSNAEVNTVFAGPASGSPGAPSYRALVGNDLPLVPNTTTVTFNTGVCLTVTIGGTPYKIALCN